MKNVNHSMAGSQATFGGKRPKGAKALNAYHAQLLDEIETHKAEEAISRGLRKAAEKALADSLRACR